MYSKAITSQQLHLPTNKIKIDFVQIADAYIFAILLGELAQLAERLQCPESIRERGQRFEPDILPEVIKKID